MAHIVEEKRWTYKDYLCLEDEKRHEILGGKLFMMTPASEFNHQRISIALATKLYSCAEKQGIGYVVSAPTDVVLDEENVVQPDIIFISKENKDIIRKRGVFGPPDIVVEIVSPSTQYNDTNEKKDLYAKSGVKEYWIVNPYMKHIEVFSLDGKGGYKLSSEGYMDEGGNTTIRSRILKGLVINLAEVFKENL